MVASQWDTGYVLDIRMTNLSTQTIPTWNLNWAFAGNSRVARGWNATYSGTNPYGARPLSWNQQIPPGNLVSIGVEVSKPGGAAPEVPKILGNICR